MTRNILVTGAAGYIGGSIIAEFAALKDGPIHEDAKVFAAVRAKEQAESLSKIGVNVIEVELSDEEGVKKAVLENKIDIIIHAASSMNPPLASNLIKALGARRKISGQDAFFIHSAVTSLFSAEVGWTFGQVKDTDPIYDLEKKLGSDNPVRATSILVLEEAKAQGVTSLNLAVPYVYGRGTGQWRRLSVSIPAVIRSAIKHKVVHKFDVEGSPPASHISDLVALYTLLTTKILTNQPIPTAEQGHYFAIAHRIHWYQVSQRIADNLYARGLVDTNTLETWPSDDVAATELGFPPQFVRAMGTLTGDLIALNASNLGWQPKWTYEKCLDNLDSEIDDLLELDTIKASVFDVLMK